MLRTLEDSSWHLYADSYRLKFAVDRPFVFLADEDGSTLAQLFVLSSIHSLSGRDDTTSIGEWQVEEHAEEIIFSLECASSIWSRKTVRFHCLPTRFFYEVEVEGYGQLVEANYFGGYYSGQLRWGSGFFWSGQSFRHGFNPEPNDSEIYAFSPGENAVIDLTGVPLPGRGNWFFTPSPFLFAFETAGSWLGLGVEARPGENLFNEYQYHGQNGSFYLSLSYDGGTPVPGHYLLPAIGFDFGPGPIELLNAHVQELQSAGMVPNLIPRARPAWWYEPIFCGWGSQCYLASLDHGRAPNYATQANYESFLGTLSEHGVVPGTVVIDDKWQQTYGDNCPDEQKWPDLPGFIRRQHSEGKKVLLWLKAWDPEGLPVEECITNAAGAPLAVDPTNPAFVRRFRRSIRALLSPQGCDADGFKIDFTARIPTGPCIHAEGDARGLELMRLYLSILYEEAKQVKPDAYIIAHTPHPYLADCVDSIRLNDINTHTDICTSMLQRTSIARAACPDALIDTDNWPMPGKDAWRDYLALQPSLGVPALYFSSHIDSTGEPLLEEDYAMLREVWAAYRSGLHLDAALTWDQKSIRDSIDDLPAIPGQPEAA